jgi:hypothetical protein
VQRKLAVGIGEAVELKTAPPSGLGGGTHGPLLSDEHLALVFELRRPHVGLGTQGPPHGPAHGPAPRCVLRGSSSAKVPPVRADFCHSGGDHLARLEEATRHRVPRFLCFPGF